MKIILGVFYNEARTFQTLKEKFDLSSFSSFAFDGEKPTNWDYEDNIILTVNAALHKCEICYFDLSSIDFTLSQKSFNHYSVLELHLILTTPEYLEKTIFYKDGEIFPKDEVVNWFLFDPFWNQYL